MPRFLSCPFDAICCRFVLSSAVFDQCVCSFCWQQQLKNINFLGDKIVVGPALSTKSSITECVSYQSSLAATVLQ